MSTEADEKKAFSLRWAVLGGAWSGLRGLLENEYSTKDIKGILGQAGLPIFKIEYTGTYKGPFLDEADALVRSLDDVVRDRFVAKCVRQIVSFERTAADRLSKRGVQPNGRTLQNLQIVLGNYGYDLEQFN